MEQKRIYLDHAATTPLKKEVLDEMLPYLTTYYGNPSSGYSIGKESKKALEHARERVANAIHANENEIFFTSGGTEADNWALRGAAYQNAHKGKHIITTSIEHHAVLHTCRQLEKEGFEVTYLPVDKFGFLPIQQVAEAIRTDTILLSVMAANNEIGTLQPIREIGELADKNGIYFHTDAVQTAGNIKVDVNELPVDLLSVSGHKFYGPKGVGALYIRNGVEIQPYMNGGGQERYKRAGTENVAGIVGMGKAMEIAAQGLTDHPSHVIYLRDKMIQYILQKIPFTQLNGHPTKRLPGNVNISFQFVEAASLLILLDKKGIAASSGSACSSASSEPSHVLHAIGLSDELAHSSLRFSLGEENTEEEVDHFLTVLTELVAELRR
ncbi:cysteine desulfurase NifS [Clostridium aminobutyricum]|uniref:Cysteine desulfurase IscS n=1 Tax=Clostridium aminobutyricum TaxID=33953 RepID=A0A939D6X4_CLOAM|nr:cysteine desulfurase NifS [Clostridium aminobutyricum]MBN7772222.1 cysteine desulfurase NifS [Clostridium aminobutyricum]